MSFFDQIKNMFTTTTNNAQMIVRPPPQEYQLSAAPPTGAQSSTFTSNLPLAPNMAASSTVLPVIVPSYPGTANVAQPQMAQPGGGYQQPLNVDPSGGYRIEVRRIDEEKIKRDLAELETRSFPSPFPIQHSIPDSYPPDLAMQPLSIDFNDRNLLISNTKKKSKEDQATLNLQLRKEKEYYENTIPNIQRKLAKLQKEVTDYKNAQNSPDYQNLTQKLTTTDAELRAQIQELESVKEQLKNADPNAYKEYIATAQPTFVPPPYVPPSPYPPPSRGTQLISETASNFNYANDAQKAGVPSTNLNIQMPDQLEVESQKNVPQYPPQAYPPPGYPPMGYPPYPYPPPGYPPQMPPQGPLQQGGAPGMPKAPHPKKLSKNNPLNVKPNL